jgi:hypothetical protein
MHEYYKVQTYQITVITKWICIKKPSIFKRLELVGATKSIKKMQVKQVQSMQNRFFLFLALFKTNFKFDTEFFF